MNKELLLSNLDELNKSYNKNRSEELLFEMESLLTEYLKQNPHDTDCWLKLAMVEFMPRLEDYDRIKPCLEHILEYDKQNIDALLILAYTELILRNQFPLDLFKKLESLQTEDQDKKAMIELAKAWFYELKKDNKMYEKALVKSIQYGRTFVSNYVKLGRLYLQQGRTTEGKELIRQGINNIKNTNQGEVEDITDTKNFFDEFYKGVTVSQPNLNSLKDLLNEK